LISLLIAIRSKEESAIWRFLAMRCKAFTLPERLSTGIMLIRITPRYPLELHL
jgi:hypothetical protein